MLIGNTIFSIISIYTLGFNTQFMVMIRFDNRRRLTITEKEVEEAIEDAEIILLVICAYLSYNKSEWVIIWQKDFYML